jgi:hypothetical protein
MDLVNRASTYADGSSGVTPFTPLTALLFVVALVVGLGGVAAFFVFMYRMSRGPAMKGPPLTGTARVLWLKQTGVSLRVNEPVTRMVCRLGLRLEVPGRQPCDVTVRQGLVPWEIDGFQPGATVPVQVDSTNPKRVRVGVGTERDIDSLTRDQLGALMMQSAGMQRWKQTYSPDLLTTGQRVGGVLRSFSGTGGMTLRMLGQASSGPDVIDAPMYMLDIELHFPNLAPIMGRHLLPVPPAQVPSLAVGRQLTCAVDPADPKHRCVVDWDAIAH